VSTYKWTVKDTPETLMTTELNSLAVGDRNITATVVSNDDAAERDLYGDFRLYLDTQATARVNPNVMMWILPEVDGTFPYGSGTLDPDTGLLEGAFGFDEATAARYAVMRGILLPPSDFHIILKNNTDTTFASSSNTLVLERYNIETVA